MDWIRFYKNIIGKPACLWRKRKFHTALSEISVLDVELAGHCNLNCRCCTHFSPIAEPEEISIPAMEKDFARLQKILGGKVRRIHLLGGEPLLHGDICECMRVARRYFPNGKIIIVTNGLLLLKEPDAFWETARKERIGIEVTRYPIRLDYKGMRKKAKETGVSFRFYGRSGYIQKTQYFLPLDCEGKQQKEESYRNCFMARNCFTLRDGKLFPCSYAAFIDRFNQRFGKQIPITAADYGDIYTESGEEILKKLGKAIPMCSYCDVSHRSYGNRWGTTRKEIGEWTREFS